MNINLTSIITILFMCLQMENAMAYNSVIYGDDDRLDLYQVSSQQMLDIAGSTAAMIPNRNIKKIRSGFKIKAGSLEYRKNICPDAKFSKQMTAAVCSGFLVAPKLLVTAGHCIRSLSDCNKYSWVFDYSIKIEGQLENGEYTADKKNIFKCSKIIERSYGGTGGNDFSLVELDREVLDRQPLKIRKQGKINLKEALVVIGYPSGLPVKIAAGAAVRVNTNKFFFTANLDTFAGNSGSAVFNSKTLEVEGILVRGERDYVYDRKKGCMTPKVCSNLACRGEDVTRITNIKSNVSNF